MSKTHTFIHGHQNSETVCSPPCFHALFFSAWAQSLPASHPAVFLEEQVTASLCLLVLKIKRTLFWGGYFNPSKLLSSAISKTASQPAALLNMPGAHWQYTICAVRADNYLCRALVTGHSSKIPILPGVVMDLTAAKICLHALKRVKHKLCLFFKLLVYSVQCYYKEQQVCSQPTWPLSPDNWSSSLLLVANGLWSTPVITVYIYLWVVLAFKPVCMFMAGFWKSPTSFATLVGIHAFIHPDQEFSPSLPGCQTQWKKHFWWMEMYW